MAKKAVMVGCNYPGTKAELHGCINDVWRMHKALVERFNFDEQDITVLIDTDSEYTQPTGANIKRALHGLVDNSQPGDILFFHYSGHGTRLPAETGEEDDTGYDECIVPCDMNLINDEDFRELIDKLPRGVTFTIVSDSCHSGGLIDEEKEQIGDSFEPQRDMPEGDPQDFSGANRGYDGGYEEESEGGGWGGFLKKGLKQAWESDSLRDAVGIGRHRQHNYGDGGYGGSDYGRTDKQHAYVGGDDVEVKNKALSIEMLIELLKDKTGRQDVEVGNIRPTLYDTFGEDSSTKVKKFVQVIMGRLQGGGGGGGGGEGGEGGFMGMVGTLATQFLQQKLDQSDDSEAYAQPAMNAAAPRPQSVYAGVKPGNRVADMGILVSGCQSDQTSADAKPGGDASQAYGALSNAIQTILASSEPGQPITNRHLVTEARRLLKAQGYTQQPGLYCTDENSEAPFIC